MADERAEDAPVRLTALVSGHVQGVGFRWWTRSCGLELGLVGSAVNLPDGRVEVVVEGARPDCAAMLERLRGPATPGRVTGVAAFWGKTRGGLAGFSAG